MREEESIVSKKYVKVYVTPIKKLVRLHRI